MEVAVKMQNRKSLRTHGKVSLSNYFQEFDEGDRVAVVQELSLHPKFPQKLQGRAGIIIRKRGSCYVVEIKDLNKTKTYIIHPVHLRRLK